jgi:rod shape-determining protein MreD
MVQMWRKLELMFWAAMPCLITGFLLILYLAPKHAAGLGQFMPALPMIPMFYWGLLHAREMPYWFVFVIGLVMDSISGAPLGLSSLLYMFFLAMLHAQRKYIVKEGFVIKWGYFGALLALMLAIQWTVMFALTGQPQGFGQALLQWLLTIFCYPPLHKAFDLVYERISERRWELLHGR